MATETTFIQFAEGAAPSTPASTKWRVYFKTDGIYVIDDAGTETGPLGAGGGASLGAWTDYTPTWTATTTNPTLGNGTLVGRYKELDATTGVVQVNLTFGSTSNAGSGNWQFSLPSGWTSANRLQLLTGHMLDAGSTNFLVVGKVAPSDTKIYEINVADGTNPRNLTNNAPVTWANGDTVTLNGMIEFA